jgi:hypothetical protein
MAVDHHPAQELAATSSGRTRVQRLRRARTGTEPIVPSPRAAASSYHQIALAQSSRSFFWALIGSGIGLALFAAAVVFPC